MRHSNASKAFSERQPAIPQTREASRVGCFLVRGWRAAMSDIGTEFANVEVGGRSRTLLSASGNQQRHQQDDKAGLRVQAVCGGRVLAILPSQLEGINCGHIGADDQLTPDPRVWKTSAPRNSEGRPARLPRTESGGYFCQCGCAPEMVSKRIFKLAMSDGLRASPHGQGWVVEFSRRS